MKRVSSLTLDYEIPEFFKKNRLNLSQTANDLLTVWIKKKIDETPIEGTKLYSEIHTEKIKEHEFRVKVNQMVRDEFGGKKMVELSEDDKDKFLARYYSLYAELKMKEPTLVEV